MDVVYLFFDSEWGFEDVLFGKVMYNGGFVVGVIYILELIVKLLLVKVGSYCIIVCIDIYNQVNEVVNECNNMMFSVSVLVVIVLMLVLGVLLQMSFVFGEQCLYCVIVGVGEVLQVLFDVVDNFIVNEFYVCYGDVVSFLVFDFGVQQVLLVDLSVVVFIMQVGDYYVFIQGCFGVLINVMLIVKILFFSIIDVSQDQGGDSKWVIVIIMGVGFKFGVVVKFVCLGIFEVMLVCYEIIDVMIIKVIFDLINVLYGFYDVVVINFNGVVVILFYWYFVEMVLFIDVIIGLGGLCVVFLGQMGFYSILL